MIKTELSLKEPIARLEGCLKGIRQYYHEVEGRSDSHDRTMILSVEGQKIRNYEKAIQILKDDDNA